MNKTLVIVESPAKAKTIGRYLGPNYRISASVGHVRDLPSSSLGVDVEKDFAPRYINMKGKDKVIRELKAEAKEADAVLIATDPDREGEAIAWHLANLLKIEPESKARITFNEITEKAVKAAVQEPRRIDMDLVNAQQARRVLDRLVGYELSPLLWKKIRTGLSAGRVQSVATRMLVEREEAIRSFEPKEYWNLTVTLLTEAGERFKAYYHGRLKGSDKLERVKLQNKEETEAVLNEIRSAAWSVHKIKKGQKKRRPYAPFTTSTLQQEAAKRLGYSSKKTMSIAQQLYEGVDLPGAGATALLTYIRTDSVRISPEAQSAARALIQTRYGERFLPSAPRFYRNKSAAQDAHEAIRPAHFEYPPEKLREALSNDQYRLYRLIWERFLASQMASALIDTLVVDTRAAGQIFRSTGESVVFPGFLAAYADVELDRQEKGGEEEAEQVKQQIPPLTEGQALSLEQALPEQKFTLPPPRYTEASLIKAMEEEGIGRPSTYAPTISTILARNYAEKEKRQLVPTELGFVVTELLRDNFNDVINLKFTAEMENELDKVEDGEMGWTQILRNFYDPFHKLVLEAQEKVERVKMAVEYTGEKCPECHEGDLIIRTGRYGKFIACSNFPECKYTGNVAEKSGAHCPLCGAAVLARKSKRGNLFYVCAKDGPDPACGFISWDLPIDGRHCETCGAYMVMKRFRGRSYPKCSNKDCPSNRRRAAGTGGEGSAAASGKDAAPETAAKTRSKRASGGGKSAGKTAAKKAVRGRSAGAAPDGTGTA